MQRNKNIDLIRIIAILFITTWHSFLFSSYGMNGNLQLLLDSGKMFAFGLCSASNFLIIGVNLFFLISGYCRIKLTAKKVITIIVTVFFVYFLCAIINMCFEKPRHSFYYFVRFFYDTVFCIRKYWYVNVYVLLMLLSPVLNMVVDEVLTGRKFLIFTFGFIFLTGVVYFVFNLPETGINGGYSIVSAAGLYIIGGGIRKFDSEVRKVIAGKKRLLAFICMGGGNCANFIIAVPCSCRSLRC